MRDLISHLPCLLTTLNHVFYLLLSFGETLSSSPLRKQVWKTKAKRHHNKIICLLCHQHAVCFFFFQIIIFRRPSCFSKENYHWWLVWKNHWSSPKHSSTFRIGPSTITGACIRCYVPWPSLNYIIKCLQHSHRRSYYHVHLSMRRQNNLCNTSESKKSTPHLMVQFLD